jgi:hypothetical protein
MKTYIVGLTGLAGSGKDTAAQYLTEALRARAHTVDTIAFADPIRQMLAALGVSHADMADRDRKERPIEGFNGASYRHMAQTLGTEWGRQCMGQSFWLARAQARLDRASEVGKAPDFLIITDLRFLNEVNWVLAKGGVVVRVQRANTQATRPHESEVQLANYAAQHTLANDADLINLRSRCAHLSHILLAERALEA